MALLGRTCANRHAWKPGAPPKITGNALAKIGHLPSAIVFKHSNQLHYRCSPTAKPDCSPGSDVRNPGRNTSVVYFNLICVTGLIIE